MSKSTPWLSHAEKLLDQRHLKAAISCFRLAEQKGADPDACAAGRWMASMLLGQFEDAWKESDAIRLRGSQDPHRFWNGVDVCGKRVLVRCLHGLGDAVQFLRYIPLLRRKAARVTVEVPPSMLELARMIDGVERAITWGECAPKLPPQWEVQVEVTELPYMFRTTICDLPVASRYLRIPDAWQRRFRLASGTGRLQAGVVWSAGEWNPSRSVPLDVLAPLLQTPGCDFWNLQGGAVRDEWRDWCGRAHIHDAPAACADAGLVPLTAFIAQLDLVITVDTLAAHLAAAMGRPTWILLQHQADWRWMHSHDHSPWYPTGRLFRQPAPRDWPGVVRHVSRALVTLLDTRMSRKAA